MISQTYQSLSHCVIGTCGVIWLEKSQGHQDSVPRILSPYRKKGLHKKTCTFSFTGRAMMCDDFHSQNKIKSRRPNSMLFFYVVFVSYNFKMH